MRYRRSTQRACHALAFRDFPPGSLVASLPNPGGLTGETLRAAAARDASADLLPVAQLFQHLHAGLMTNVAFFRHQLG